jgi:hypothetical protein
MKGNLTLSSKTKDELIKDINECKVNGSFELGIAIKNKKMFKDFYTKACKNLESINHDIITKKRGLLCLIPSIFLNS